MGRNGVAVYEQGAYYFNATAVAAATLSGWTHVAVRYRDGVPSIYLNGKSAHKGVKGPWNAHLGLGLEEAQPVPPVSRRDFRLEAVSPRRWTRPRSDS